MAEVFGIITPKSDVVVERQHLQVSIYAETLFRRLSEGPVNVCAAFDPDTCLRIIVKKRTSHFTLREAPTDPSTSEDVNEILDFNICRYDKHVQNLLDDCTDQHPLRLLFQGILYNENWNYMSPTMSCCVIRSYGLDVARLTLRSGVRYIIGHQNQAIKELITAGIMPEEDGLWLIQDPSTVDVIKIVTQYV